jgi:hypothetical protein
MFAEDIVDNLLLPNSEGFTKVSEKVSRLLGASYIPSMKWYVVANITLEVK